jgi:hypothetical protein
LIEESAKSIQSALRARLIVTLENRIAIAEQGISRRFFQKERIYYLTDVSGPTLCRAIAAVTTSGTASIESQVPTRIRSRRSISFEVKPLRQFLHGNIPRRRDGPERCNRSTRHFRHGANYRHNFSIELGKGFDRNWAGSGMRTQHAIGVAVVALPLLVMNNVIRGTPDWG